MDRSKDYCFPEMIRKLMKEHPVTGKVTSQKTLAVYIGIRPQSLSLYCTGESKPNAEKLLKIADYFGVTADYLLVGYSDNNRMAADKKEMRKEQMERIAHIAVLCSQAENEALTWMSEEEKSYV